MKKTIPAVLTATALASILSIGVAATGIALNVPYDESDLQEFKSGSLQLENYYDYGTTAPFDNVQIYANAEGSGATTAKIRYKPLNSGTWCIIQRNSNGSFVEAKYNPAGVDMLQEGSYAMSVSNGCAITLNVVAP